MRKYHLALIVLLILTACVPAAAPSSVPATVTVLFTPEMPTATGTALPSQTPTRGPAQQIGMPDSLKEQFPLQQQPDKYWTLFGSPDKARYIPDFNLKVGDLVVVSVVAVQYLNAAGQPDFVYVPVTTINPGKKQCVNEGPSRPIWECASFLDQSGENFKLEDRERLSNYSLNYFLASRKQVVEIRFGYPSKLTQSVGSKGYFDNAMVANYPNQILSEFAKTGDSSLLPNRLLIPFFFEASYPYSVQVATSTPIPMNDVNSGTTTGTVNLKDIGQYDSISKQIFPLTRDNITGNPFFHCLAGKTNYESIWVTDTILITGTVDCHYTQGVIKFPLGIYDLTQNRLLYWGMFPLEDTTLIDYLSFRAEERFTHFIKDYQYENKTNKLVNLQIFMGLGIPNDKNSIVMDTASFKPYINAFYADPARLEALNKFIETGAPPEDGLVFPLELGVATTK